jgi:hypothetical protein
MAKTRYSIDSHASVVYCIKHYASYGMFATYCLRTAILATDVYTLSSFKRAFLSSGDDHCDDPKLQKFLKLIPYEDSDYFSVSETRFLLQLSGGCSLRNDAELSRDHRRVSREIKRGKRILPSHAKFLAKAIEYWRLRYNGQYSQWQQRFEQVNGERILRATLRNLFGTMGGETTMEHEDSLTCGFCGEPDD